MVKARNIVFLFFLFSAALPNFFHIFRDGCFQSRKLNLKPPSLSLSFSHLSSYVLTLCRQWRWWWAAVWRSRSDGSWGCRAGGIECCSQLQWRFSWSRHELPPRGTGGMLHPFSMNSRNNPPQKKTPLFPLPLSLFCCISLLVRLLTYLSLLCAAGLSESDPQPRHPAWDRRLRGALSLRKKERERDRED